MRILFVVHGINQKGIKMAQKKKQMLSEQMNCVIDSCIYAEKKEMEGLRLESLGGQVYTLPVTISATDMIARYLFKFIKKMQYTAVVVADGGQAGELAVQLAQLLEVQCVTAVTELSLNKERVFLKKMVYNNMVCADYHLPEEFVISEKFAVGNVVNKQVEVSEIIELEPCNVPDYILDNIILEERTQQMVSPILIAVGMGIQSKEEVSKIREYASDCGFSFGVSRPVAMRGWGDIREIIGVSGEIYAPQLTIAIGISGAAAFMIGIEQSNYILSINSNPDAMITKLSDSIIVDEYQHVLPKLFEYLKQWRKTQ